MNEFTPRRLVLNTAMTTRPRVRRTCFTCACIILAGILFALGIVAMEIVWIRAAHADVEPYSCQMYREASRKCAYNTIGKCYVEAEMIRLRKQCVRDGGNP